jgi:CRISPR-associated protein Csm1
MKHISDRVYCIALASLLHDIGKPMQRAVKSQRSTLKTEGARSMDRADLVKYPHALWTSDFIFENKDIFDKLEPVLNYGFEKFQKLASKHHKPDGAEIDELIIQAADCASAGFDRQIDTNTDYEDIGRDAYIVKPLVSLFTRVILEGQEYPAKYNNLGTLESDAIFPEENVKLNFEEYMQLMQGFYRDFKNLPTGNATIFFDALLSLVGKYFWCVPSSTMEGYADIPLSDHCITTAAIASAMAICCVETGCSPKSGKYLLVAGDFSGIQKFIFALSGESNRNVAALLRGRSFMVNMYNNLCARFLVDTCGLPACNILTTAGGKFQVLLPDTTGTRSKLENVKKQVEQWAFDSFYGELKLLVTTGTEFSYTDFTLQNFQDVLNRCTDQLNREKHRVFSAILTNQDLWIDNKRYPDFQKNRICPICGKEPGDAGKPGVNCTTYIDIGKRLRNKECVVIKTVDGTEIFNRFVIEITDFEDIAINDIHSLYRINLQDAKLKDNTICWPELHYANYVPRECEDGSDDDNETVLLQCKSFENIAETASGLKALAVLKADVDNMGLVFSQGFNDKNGHSRLSVSRMVSMSRMLNWFFTGYLPLFIKRNTDYRNIYTLFAGGDDLCLIGPWNTMVDFAATIQKEFAKYTGNTPNITISAGLDLFKPSSPVVNAVEKAELVLEKAKQNEGKNSIALFGYVMKWNEEFECQLQFTKEWLGFIEYETQTANSSNRNAMLYRFLQYHQEWERAVLHNEQLRMLKHRFRFIYDINRNLAPKKNSTKDWRFMAPFKNLLATQTLDMEKQPLFKFLPVGITLAVYKKRETSIIQEVEI